MALDKQASPIPKPYLLYPTDAALDTAEVIPPQRCAELPPGQHRRHRHAGREEDGGRQEPPTAAKLHDDEEDTTSNGEKEVRCALNNDAQLWALRKHTLKMQWRRRRLDHKR